jgi:hypothetical protein
LSELVVSEIVFQSTQYLSHHAMAVNTINIPSTEMLTLQPGTQPPALTWLNDG